MDSSKQVVDIFNSDNSFPPISTLPPDDVISINIEDTSSGYEQISIVPESSPIEDLNSLYSEPVKPSEYGEHSSNSSPHTQDQLNIAVDVNEIVSAYEQPEERTFDNSSRPTPSSNTDKGEPPAEEGYFSPPITDQKFQVFKQEKESAFNRDEWAKQVNKLKNWLIIILISTIGILIIVNGFSKATPKVSPSQNTSHKESITIAQGDDVSTKPTEEALLLSEDILDECIIVLDSCANYANRDSTRILAKSTIGNALKVLKKHGADESIIGYVEDIYAELCGDGNRDTVFLYAKELDKYLNKGLE